MEPCNCELSTRERMVQATCELLEAQGYHATGLNEILQRSSAPRGSLYYYFPEGKEELAAEAIEQQGRLIGVHIRQALAAADDVADAVQALLEQQAACVSEVGSQSLGPITAVALESATTNERLRQACAQVYADWRAIYAERLLAAGYSEEDAAALSLVILETSEGAIALARTLRSAEPLEQAAKQLGRMLRLVRPQGA